MSFFPVSRLKVTFDMGKLASLGFLNLMLTFGGNIGSKTLKNEQIQEIDMNKWVHKFEELIDRLIPPSLLLLAAVIVVEIFFKDFAHEHHAWVVGADYFVITVFVFDLAFKWNRIRKIPRFLRECWLDIIAVFPFVTFFRVAENIFVFSAGARELIAKGQPVLHEGVEIQKEVARIMREAESVGKISRVRVFLRSARFTRLFRIFARTPRFIKAFAFYERPYRHPKHKKLVIKKKKRPQWHHKVKRKTTRKKSSKR